MSIDVDKNMAFLRKLPEPKDDLDRSYNQYRCQRFEKGALTSFLLDLGSMLYLLFYRAKKRVVVSDSSDVVIRQRSNWPQMDLVPAIYRNDPSLHVSANAFASYRSKNYKLLCKQMRHRHFFSFYFRLKCKIVLADYAGLIAAYHPKAVVSCNEFSFTSSLATRLCEMEGVRSINVMHGEKLFDIRDSFFRYHEMYAWDEETISMLKKLRTEETQFRLHEPVFLVAPKAEEVFDFTYYLQIQSKEELETIAHSLGALQQQGYKTQVRYHPKYTDVQLADPIFQKYGIPKDVGDIQTSVGQSKNCISEYSTVLYRAYLSGKTVIIDDVINSEKIKKLARLDYHMLSKPHKLLSSFLKETGDSSHA